MAENEFRLARDVPAGPGRIIKIQLVEYKGEHYVDIRYWLEIDGDMRATPKGIRIHAELIDELLEGIGAARDYIEGRTTERPAAQAGS